MEEWEEILNALAESMPVGSYPTWMYGSNNQGDTHIMTLLRSFGGNVFNEDGTFDFTKPEILKALNWIYDGVDKGWYVPHAENVELIDNDQLFQDDKLGLFIFNNGFFTLLDNIPEHYGFVNFPGILATSFITGFEVFDNGDPAKVAAAKDLIRFIYEDEETLDLSAGNLPESKRVAKKFENDIEMLEQFSENAANVYDFMNGTNNWQGRDDSVRSLFWKEIHNMLAKARPRKKQPSG